MRQEAGFRKTIVRLLLAMPICAATTVLLIQNSLPLAFGQAALVAALRFRVSLQDPIDGVDIFAAVCVGLSAGIGYMGIAAVMTFLLCLENALLWCIDHGRDALDDARMVNDRNKLQAGGPFMSRRRASSFTDSMPKAAAVISRPLFWMFR
jgi:hypothetical protein